MFRFLFIIVFLLFSGKAYLFSQSMNSLAQRKMIEKADSLLSTNIDRAIRLSLYIQNNDETLDSLYVKSVILLQNAYEKKEMYDSSIFYIDKGLKKCMEMGDSVNVYYFYSDRGVMHFIKADYSSALSDFVRAKDLYERYKGRKKDEMIPLQNYARILNNMGSAYLRIGLYDSSLVYFYKSLKIRKEINAPLNMLVLNKLNIGVVYSKIEDYENGWKIFESALKDAVTLNDSALLARCYLNIGVFCNKTGDYRKAIGNYEKSLEINKLLDNKRSQSLVLQNLSSIYISLRKYELAKKYLHRALSINGIIKANSSSVYLGLGNLFYDIKNFDSSAYYTQIALQQARKSGYVDNEMESAHLLYEINKKRHKFGKALSFMEQYNILKDSVLNSENLKNIQRLKTEFETEKKEKEISFLQKINESETAKATLIQSRQRLIILFSLLALVLLIIVLVFYFFKRKKEKELYRIEKKLMKMELKNKDLASNKLKMQVDFKTKQLTAHSLNMMKKNRMLIEIYDKLKVILKKVDDNLKPEINNIIYGIQLNQKSDKDWELFKQYFENVKSDFTSKLRAVNPKLTTNDYRLAALITLNLNIKECAALLSISPTSVKMARYRLRKKLNIGNGKDLYTFLSEL